jgi:hypothetical protein
LLTSRNGLQSNAGNKGSVGFFDLINAAYRLTPDEVVQMWRTASLHMRSMRPNCAEVATT